MLSYRHAFHAGNHGDVLKHLVLMQVIERLKQKDKPISYLDSHSGAGLYDLFGDYARKTGEFAQGISKLSDFSAEMPEPLRRYLDLVVGDSRYYPGSPLIAAKLLREQDKLTLMELHNREVENLRDTMRSYPQTSIHHRNGFEGLNALLPPTPRRGLVLIDPSYETADDYQAVVRCVEKSYKKWATGIYLIWYPILSAERDKSQRLINSISALPLKSLLNISLSVSGQAQDFGMHGSGLLVINAPYQLDCELSASLNILAQALAQDEHAKAQCDWLIESA